MNRLNHRLRRTRREGAARRAVQSALAQPHVLTQDFRQHQSFPSCTRRDPPWPIPDTDTPTRTAPATRPTDRPRNGMSRSPITPASAVIRSPSVFARHVGRDTRSTNRSAIRFSNPRRIAGSSTDLISSHSTDCHVGKVRAGRPLALFGQRIAMIRPTAAFALRLPLDQAARPSAAAAAAARPSP